MPSHSPRTSTAASSSPRSTKPEHRIEAKVAVADFAITNKEEKLTVEEARFKYFKTLRELDGMATGKNAPASKPTEQHYNRIHRAAKAGLGTEMANAARTYADSIRNKSTEVVTHTSPSPTPQPAPLPHPQRKPRMFWPEEEAKEKGRRQSKRIEQKKALEARTTGVGKSRQV